MSVFTRMFGDVKAAASGDMAAFDAVRPQPPSPTTENPMQQAIDAFAKTRAEGKLQLDMVIDKACVLYPSMPAQEMANLSGCDVQRVTITQSSIDRLRDMSGDPDLCLNLRDANISGCVFLPASTFAGCLVDQVSVSRSTDATNVTFDGLSKQQTDLHFTKKGNWTGFAIKGAGEATWANLVNLTVAEGAMACAGDISGSRLTKLNATNADLSGLNAAGAKGMACNVVGGRLNGADFSNCSIAPDSRISADLIGANFEGATLGDCCLAGSRVIGANFNGVDITNVNLDGVILRPEDLHGAIHESQTITAENVGTFLQNRVAEGQQMKVQGPDTAVRTQVGPHHIQGASAIDQVKQAVLEMRDGGNATPTTQTAHVSATPKVDGLVDALCEVQKAMACGNIKLDNIESDKEVTAMDEYHTVSHQREHEVLGRGTERV